MSENEIEEFVAQFLEDEINQKIIQIGTYDQLEFELWRDASDYFGHGYISDEFIGQLLHRVQSRG